MSEMKQKRSTMVKGSVAAFLILIVVVFMVIVIENSDGTKLNKLLDLGNKYLTDMDYENAVLAFDQAIAIDPKCEEAYMGKARAQYAMGQYEDAIATLEEGIAMVEDSSRLEEFLQTILNEIEGETNWESAEEAVVSDVVHKPLQLNYTNIVRFTDTQDAEIQLEIVGDEGNAENYSWTSSNPECAVVSEAGLLTCLDVEGYAYIYAENEFGKSDECILRICSSGNGSESEEIRIIGAEEEQGYTVSVIKEEGGENVAIDVLGQYVYYEGDIEIPETLQFNGRELKVTEISNWAFRWSDKLDSIYIPAGISNIRTKGEEYSNPFYFCTNLKKIDVDANNDFLQVVDGVLYSKDGAILYAYPAGKEGSSYTIPKEVEKVCSGAFLGCENLKEILVEDGNRYYESVDGVLVEKEYSRLVAYPIGNAMTNYKVPDQVAYLSENVFYGSNLEEIDCSSVTEIYEAIFRGCNLLERIKGGENTTYIFWMYSTAPEFVGIDQMKNLKSFYLKPSEAQDFSEFASLDNLDTLDIDAEGLAPDLKVLGGIPALSKLEIANADLIEDFSWISKMNNLEELRLHVSEKFPVGFDLKQLQMPANLRILNIWTVDKVTDLSWMIGMEDLQGIDIVAEKFEVTDLSPLLALNNLSYVEITSASSDMEELGDDIKQQIEEIKDRNPEARIQIWE